MGFGDEAALWITAELGTGTRLSTQPIVDLGLGISRTWQVAVASMLLSKKIPPWGWGDKKISGATFRIFGVKSAGKCIPGVPHARVISRRRLNHFGLRTPR